MNIIISGWPGAGTTSLALLLCDLLEYKYVYGGGVLKHLCHELYGVTSGPQFIEFEQKYGVVWDHIWEPYALWKLEKFDRILLEGKTTGFFAESDRYYEIMMIAKVAARAGRAVNDKRIDAENTIMARDVVVRQRWINEFGVDIYDPGQIADNYDITIDNSNMTIKDELQFVLTNLEEDYRFPRSDLAAQMEVGPKHVEELLTVGKDAFKANLNARGLIHTSQEVLKEWQRPEFREQLAALPPELKAIVMSA